MAKGFNKKEFLQILLLVFVSSGIAVLIGEGVLRVYEPYGTFDTGKELSWMRTTQIFTIDPEFGFRPKLNNSWYSEFGTRQNDYGLEKRAGITRILFLGDSVTNRAKIIDALRDQYGEEDFEYWNAGVESFNTVQEVAFYKRFNSGISPDHVIVTFHLNDFETTPIAFKSGGKFLVYAPHMPSRRINPRLFEYSYIYRVLLRLTIQDRELDRAKIIDETEAALAKLKTLLQTENIALTVLVLPYLKPYESWSKSEHKSREIIISILQRLDIRYFDLLGVLNHALEDGLAVQQIKGDTWHPNNTISKRFAEYLHEHEIF